MSILKRFKNTLKSEANSAVKSMSNPVKVLDLKRDEAKISLDKLKTSVGIIYAEHKRAVDRINRINNSARQAKSDAKHFKDHNIEDRCRTKLELYSEYTTQLETLNEQEHILGERLEGMEKIAYKQKNQIQIINSRIAVIKSNIAAKNALKTVESSLSEFAVDSIPEIEENSKFDLDVQMKRMEYVEKQETAPINSSEEIDKLYDEL